MGSSAPTEILLYIFQDVFTSQVVENRCRDPSADSEHIFERQALRLTVFCSLVRVCKAWVDAARAVFWEDVTVSGHPSNFNIDKLALALGNPSSRAACIRRVHLLVSPYTLLDRLGPLPPNVALQLVRKVKTYLPIILRELPRRLDVLDIQCQHDVGKAVFEILNNLGEPRTFNPHHLSIRHRPDGGDISRVFENFHNVAHLRLSISPFDDGSTYSTPISMELHSLVIDIEVHPWGGPPTGCLADAARGLAASLCSASLHLRSLTLNFMGPPRDDDFVSVFKYLHQLGHSTVSVLTLRTINDPDSLPDILAADLAAADAFSPFPSLRHLILDEFGVSPDAIIQMSSSQLETLEVIVTEALEFNGLPTMKAILASMELPELSTLDVLDVKFGRLPYFYFKSGSGPEFGEWRDTRETWAPIEELCTLRQISCLIDHPEETEDQN